MTGFLTVFLQDSQVAKEANQALELWEKAYRETQKAVKKAPAREGGQGEEKYSYNVTGYSSVGVSWLAQDGVLTKSQMAKFYEAVANISKRGYYCPISKNGMYMVDLGNVVVFTDADFENPQIYKAIEFFTSYDQNLSEYKEWIYVEERNTAGHGKALALIENLQGDGYVSEHVRKDYQANAGKERSGKRSDSGNPSGTGKKRGNPSGVSYSLSGTEDIFYENAQRQAAEQGAREQIANMRKYIGPKTIRNVTDGEADGIARKLLWSWGADMEEADLRQDIRSLYDQITKDTEADPFATALEIGKKIAGNLTEVDGDVYKEYADLRKQLRDTRIYVSGELPPCSRRQANVHRALAFDCSSLFS